MTKGAKATHLSFLQNKKFRIPDFIVLPTDLSPEIVFEAVEDLNDYELFAVRSSSIAEDSKKKSYAGYFYSEIGVKKEDVYNAYLKVCLSFKEYKGAVIIQRFIPSDVSGVLFTNDGNNNIIINANIGLCKSVVEGWSCDELLISKKGVVLSKNHPKNKSALIWEDLQMNKKNINHFSLTDLQIKLLIEKCIEIESLLNAPQDIEWCFYKEKLYILQSRPITAEINEKKETIYYDSANVSESYSGIISPLTISFASLIYEVVYKNLIHRSGVPWRKLNQQQDVFHNMVNAFSGRLYYNMNNWYTMMSFLPGYNRNKKNLEDMITSNVKEEVHRNVKPTIFLKFYYPLIVIWKIIKVKYNNVKFHALVSNYIKTFRTLDLSNYSFNDCVNTFEEMNNTIIKKWYIPVENDFLVMTYFGILKKRFDEKELNQLISFESKTSTQINALKNLAELIKKHPAINELMQNKSHDQLKKIIDRDPVIKEELNNYFLEFGGRFANELKLESPDLEEDYTQFFHILNQYQNIDFNTSKSIHNKKSKSWILKQFKKYATQREEFRLLRSNSFSLVRKLFNRIGEIFQEENRIENTEDIYYLEIEEILKEKKSYKNLILERKVKYNNYKNIEIPSFFGMTNGVIPDFETEKENDEKFFQGRGCAKGTITGKIKVFEEYYFPDKIDFQIIVAKHTDPGWTPLLGFCKGLIIEHGGILSHAAIVSRELGIPTVIGVKNVTKTFHDGQIVQIDGGNGTIKLINE